MPSLALQRIANFLIRHSFILFATALIIFESISILNTDTGGDFWEHAAVVNELSKNPFHPSNPIISAGTPHAFFSPYALLAGLVSKLTKLDSIYTLHYCFSFFNLFFFLFCFYRFCRSLFIVNRQLIATVSLLFILFFWGKEPFPWSGFYHIMVLNYVLCYPSTFAMALSLLVLSMLAREPFGKFHSPRILLMILLNTIVLLTHPTTAIQLFAGIMALNYCFSNYSFKNCLIRSSLVILPALLLSLCWPYFKILGLAFGNNEDFHNVSRLLYRAIISKNWPFLLVLPALLIVKIDKIVFFFSIYIVLLVLGYTGGYMTRNYGLSRLISGIMVSGQFLMAYITITAVKASRPWARVYAGLLGIAFAISLLRNNEMLQRSFALPRIRFYEKYDFLRDMVGPEDIILSDKRTNWIIPAYSGKVIASANPLYWVNDLPERRKVIESFFTKETPDSARQRWLNKYHPAFILLDHSTITLEAPTLAWLETSAGKIIYQKGPLELIRLNQ